MLVPGDGDSQSSTKRDHRGAADRKTSDDCQFTRSKPCPFPEQSPTLRRAEPNWHQRTGNTENVRPTPKLPPTAGALSGRPADKSSSYSFAHARGLVEYALHFGLAKGERMRKFMSDSRNVFSSGTSTLQKIETEEVSLRGEESPARERLLSPRISRDVSRAIGKVPTVRLNRLSEVCRLHDLCLKLESCNPGGSIKEKNAVYLIEEAEREGLLRPAAPGISVSGLR